MTEAPDWLHQLLGWKPATAKSRSKCDNLFGEAIAPNLADVGSVTSMHLASYAYETMGIPRSRLRTGKLESDGKKQSSSGAALEKAIETDLRSALPAEDPERGWLVSRRGNASSFAQFTHLKDLQQLLQDNPTFRATVAGDYQVKTDVYVGVTNRSRANGPPLLHAAISSKWTIRSDRVQNVRHEFATLVRSRRGRAPHLVLVTAEPMPSRLLSIARGTGEVDVIYHLLYDEIDQAVGALCGDGGLYTDQLDAWGEMIEQRRLRPYADLATDLSAS